MQNQFGPVLVPEPVRFRAGGASRGAIGGTLRWVRRIYCARSRLERLGESIRWPLLALRCRAQILAWYGWLESPGMRSLARRNPRLAFKPLQVYLSTRFAVERRVRILSDSWRFAHQGSGLLVRAAQQRGGVEIARFNLFGVRDAQLKLEVRSGLRREGEFTLSLYADGSGLPVVSLAFAFEERAPGSWCAYLGCIQGARGQSGRVREVTQCLQGMRPKAFIVTVFQSLAQALGVEELFGAGHAIHVHRVRHLINVPWVHGVTADYDALWRDLRGEQRADGWFALPLRMQRRERAEIKATRRAQYQRRYALLDGIGAQIGAAVAGAAGDVAPAGVPVRGAGR